jgi:hypothetical protein
MRGRRLLFVVAAPLVPVLLLLVVGKIVPGPSAVEATVYPWRWGAVSAAVAAAAAGTGALLLLRVDTLARRLIVRHFHYSVLFYLYGVYVVVLRLFFCGECELLIGYVTLAIVTCVAAIIANALVLWWHARRAAA